MRRVQPEAASLEAALRDARGGDIAAFNVLVVAYQRQIFNVSYRSLGNSDDAADATQDALLSAYRGLKNFNGDLDGLRPWLLRIAVNTCYDHLRRRRRRPADSLDDDSDPDGPSVPLSERLVDDSLGPEAISLSSETARTIQAALDRLPPDQRLTVVLCDVQGLSYEEAAAAMSVELGTVKSRLSRARAHLRAFLVAAGELPARSGVFKRKAEAPRD